MNICAIVKDEPIHYLIEWVEHHLRYAKKIYIYNNGGQIDIWNHHVEIIPFPGKVMQLKAYQHHCVMHPNEYTLFIDADEFFYANQPISRLEYLTTKYGALGFNWQTFGSSGLIESDIRPQVDKFTKHLPMNHNINKHIKTMVQNHNVRAWLNPHQVSLKEGKYNRTITNGQTQIVDPELGWIDHYYCRSEEDFKAKIIRGRADCDVQRNWDLFRIIDWECI